MNDNEKAHQIKFKEYETKQQNMQDYFNIEREEAQI